MDVAYISALSALLGSVIGGAISGVSSWASQRLQAKSVLLGQDKLRHENPYRDFIVHASRVYADAMMHDEPQVSDLVGLYALISRMRVLSSPRLVVCAERIARTATDNYSAPNKTIVEIHDMIKRGGVLDPMKELSEAARDELQVIGSL
jgi:hypothetical protein